MICQNHSARMGLLEHLNIDVLLKAATEIAALEQARSPARRGVIYYMRRLLQTS